MAGKARAGCPISNIQQTLDCLTRVGLRAAVYEEASDTDALPGGSVRPRLKSRMLAQVVSGANPTYLYDLVLGDGYANGSAADVAADALGSSSTPSARPYVGVLSTSAGYTLVEVGLEERTVRVSERLTSEAVSCRLAAYPPADPLFYVPAPGESAAVGGVGGGGSGRLPFMPSRIDPAAALSAEGGGNGAATGSAHLRVYSLPPISLQDPTSGVTDPERAKACIVSALLGRSEIASSAAETDDGERTLTHSDFTIVESAIPPQPSALLSSTLVRTAPLYVETASQLGLLYDPTIPPLVWHLLPESAPASTRRFLRRWLLIPPPAEVAGSMADLIRELKGKDGEGTALPPLSVPPLGRVLALVRAGQASAQVFRELIWAMEATIAVLEARHRSDGVGVVAPLMVLLRHETGMAADPESLRARCHSAVCAIEEVVNVCGGRRDSDLADPVSGCGDVVPSAFFERNEASWRGRIRPHAAFGAYEEVSEKAIALSEAVGTDFWGIRSGEGLSKDSYVSTPRESKTPVVQDVFNNFIALKQVPKWAEDPDKYYHPYDRNGKLLRNRYTTKSVESAASDYVEACEKAITAVTTALAELSGSLQDGGHLPALVQSCHSNLVLSTAAHHAAQANRMGWNLANVHDEEENAQSPVGHFLNVWPYWMDRTLAVPNTFDMDGLFLLTAPNMSGKSTLMRATAAAALLSNCGLCAPLGPGSSLRRFDSIFVRGASADVPTESKSGKWVRCYTNGAVFTDICLHPVNILWINILMQRLGQRWVT